MMSLRVNNQVECLGLVQNAQWRKTSKWQLGGNTGLIG
jgi:hypothetical protein